MSAGMEHRKLAAIMFTDMVGYSALVERDETLALQLLEEHRRLLRSIFPKHEGSEIKTIGDGFLVEFSSALAAVLCGIEIQEAIARRNSANPSQGNFQLRIGIHAGDIVRRADDVIGDGVNIAARIVPLAVEGGICISKQVFEQVENRLPSSPKNMGQVKLKNMIRPLEVYWVGYRGAPIDPPGLGQIDRVSLAQKSIAVLPFINMSSDPENEYLSDGLTEDLIMAFSQLKGLRVPARTSSFAFKGKSEDVRRIGEQLNVTKILEGSVRKAGDRLRITAQLINVADGDHLWAQTFDRRLQDVFAIQDEITRAIVEALEIQLIGAGDQPLAKHGTYNTDAYQLYLQARYHFNKFTGEGFKCCIECCKKALEIEPNYALAYAALSLAFQHGWFYGHLSFEEKFAAIGPHDTAAEKAVELDPNLAESQTALAIVRFWNERKWSEAEECFKQAIKLNPNYVTAHEHYGIFLACRRRADEAIEQARQALQIDPLSSRNTLSVAGIYWLIHRYDLMLEQAHRLFDLEPNFFGTYWMLGLAHWSQGMQEAAVAELRKAVTLRGGPVPLADLGCLLGRLNRTVEAQQVLEELCELGKWMYVQPPYLGFVHASLGNHDQAFACFAQGMEHENGSIVFLREYCICAGLDDLCADPRFPALLKKIGFDETSRDDVASSGAETVVRKQLDNLATGTSESPKKCPRCGAPIRNDERTCINCLLHEGLETKGEPSREIFESILTEANVTDTHWRLGHYEILEEIGRGGMGVIYRARQQHSRRIVAVKRILAHQVNSHETLVRFRREAEAVASLDHPNILPIHEVSESEDGLPYFSMKYATGGSLRTAAPTLRTNPRECVRIMVKVGRAIAYAHSKGILHRDLQPGNILLDENEEPMVSDFGLAKWLDQGSDLTRTLETLGTPGYIAPEQTDCPAAKLTCAADVYSLGAILFYLLTGRPPFVGTNVLHVIHQAAATPAPRLRSVEPSLDRDLETIVARCLESDPKARYQSAGALADDLEHWLRHEPIRARRLGFFARGLKWVRRNPTSAVLVACLIVLAAAIGVMFWERGPVRQLPISTAVIPDKSIAVLPFENLSADPENAFFTDGVQDEILNDLAKIADLKVISRTSVMQYKSGVKRNVRQIANQLGVAHLVEGSVQRVANRVRVTAQLIDAKTDRHLWVQRYDRRLDNVFAIQSEIAQAIAAQLQAGLSPTEKAAIEELPTSDLVAYDLYLKAKELMYNGRFNPGRWEKGVFKAVQLLDEAVARDPVFLLAHCQLARAHDQIYFANWDHTGTRLALAQSSIDAAVRLQPHSGETHLAQANHFFKGYLNYDRAREELGKAQRTLPNDAEVFRLLGGMCRWQGRWDEASQNLQRSVELNPRDTTTLTDLAWVYVALRKYEEADAIASRLQTLEPRSPILRSGRAWIGLWWRADGASLRAVLNTIEAEGSQPAAEVADLSFQLAFYERDPVGAARALGRMPREGKIDMNGVPFPHTWYEGLLAKLQQDPAAAHSAFASARAETERLTHAEPGNVKPLAVLALIDAELGDKERAIHEGRTACDMLPPTKDAVDGVWLMTNLARIYALIGEHDLALEQLELLSKLGSSWFGIHYGDLRLNPEWDPLRGDPRFERLVEESKKPVVLESLQPVPSGIAVLPFENLSADSDNAFFADGVQDEILNDLAKIADLKVISRTSVMQYKSGAKRNLRQIANELGVAHVVEGSVQRVANRVRVSAQLIDAKTDTHLWAERYDRPLDDVFAIQSEIAKAIAGQLQSKLSPVEKSAIEQPPTTNLIAYDCYVRAEKLSLQEGDLREITRLLDQAVAYDPTFLVAYCLLARSHVSLYFQGADQTPARLALATQARDAALRLGPDRGESHLAAAWVAYHGYRDYETALDELDIARRSLPNDASVFDITGHIARRQGHWKQSTSDFLRAVELDPRSPRSVWLLGRAAINYMQQRRFSEAVSVVDRALTVAPSNPLLRVGRALPDMESRADTQPAHEAIQRVVTENPSAMDAIADFWFDVAIRRRDAPEMARALASLPSERRSFCEGLAARARNDASGAEKAFTAARVEYEKKLREQPDDVAALSGLGISDAALGRKEDALREGRRAVELLPVTKDAPWGADLLRDLAVIYAWVGEKDLAIRQLEEVLRIPSNLSYGHLRLHPYWDPLRGDSRFEQLLEESKKQVAL